MKTTGTIKKVIGPVVDVDFGQDESALPEIYTALEVMNGNKKIVNDFES